MRALAARIPPFANSALNREAQLRSKLKKWDVRKPSRRVRKKQQKKEETPSSSQDTPPTTGSEKVDEEDQTPSISPEITQKPHSKLAASQPDSNAAQSELERSAQTEMAIPSQPNDPFPWGAGANWPTTPFMHGPADGGPYNDTHLLGLNGHV